MSKYHKRIAALSAVCLACWAYLDVLHKKTASCLRESRAAVDAELSGGETDVRGALAGLRSETHLLHLNQRFWVLKHGILIFWGAAVTASCLRAGRKQPESRREHQSEDVQRRAQG